MLKIYNALANYNRIKIKDYIEFVNGQYDIGDEGFGKIYTDDLHCKKAHYVLQRLKTFEMYVKSIELVDGKSKNFLMLNLIEDRKLKEELKNVVSLFGNYEKIHLKEEAILLFTNHINLKYSDAKLIRKVFDSGNGNDLYLLRPKATFTMTSISSANEENYEVLQSESLGRQLVLAKLRNFR